MKLKRFFADDMRSALRLARVEMGDDAVILSKQNTEQGVEVVMAVDFDRSLFAAIRPEPTNEHSVTSSEHQSDEHDALKENVQSEEVNAGEGSVSGVPLEHLHQDIGALKKMLEGSFSRLAWDDAARRNPLFFHHLRRLSRLGFAARVATGMATELVNTDAAIDSDAALIGYLKTQLVTSEIDLIGHGGVAAFVGPTGVGKTTTIVKIAARAARLHGPSNIALISADANRIGAHDQLGRIAGLLGIDMYTVDSCEELQDSLASLRDRQLVLIDTAGMSQSDPELDIFLLGLLGIEPGVKILLTIAANAQFASLDWIAQRYKEFRVDAVVLTKTDESAHLGSSLSALLKHRMELCYITDGQVIPDDLHPASHSMDWLLECCLSPSCAEMASLAVDDDYLAQTLRGDSDVRIR